MISFQQCASYAGLDSDEVILGVTPSERHDLLLSSYLLNSGLSKTQIRKRIVSDLRGFLELGAAREAADRLIVLRHYLADHPEARLIALPSANAARVVQLEPGFGKGRMAPCREMAQ